MMSEDPSVLERPKAVYLEDYRPPPYLVESVELHFFLNDDFVKVQSKLDIRSNGSVNCGNPFVLDGNELELISIAIDGLVLEESSYILNGESLCIKSAPDFFSLEIETKITPQDNTSLEGLYRSGGIFCTQCEAEGFRKITYFPDRSDILAKYVVTIEADRSRYPVLLSNGNLVQAGEIGQDRHFVTWEDPFPKPSYLFALVAGDLVCLEDKFINGLGREILLQIFVEEHNKDKCGHALASLKKAMVWDEEVYGLEYDLDRYMIVAVDDFNMGAMENKGLNIFNSKYVLAKPKTATDNDYENIEAVIAHEYFHNWTGNRVTCRDWFQLSLKEGLTVFREQEFTADMVSRSVKRISDVRLLRDMQFPEDAGPMAHAVRPVSYIEINNFYTVTVYEKGAELIRMLQIILGRDLFLRGVQRYLTKHDGSAATTDDFVAAMEEVSGRDFSQFRLWYSQAGTPLLEVETAYDAKEKEFHLTIRQTCPATPGQESKEPFHIPIAVGLIDGNGQDIPLSLAGGIGNFRNKTHVLELCEEEQTFKFLNVPERPVLSLLRNFSAPVLIKQQADMETLSFLRRHDSDSFNRWEAGQIIAKFQLEGLIKAFQTDNILVVDSFFIELFGEILQQAMVMDDSAYAAQLLTLPSEKYLAEAMEVVDVDAIHAARLFLKQSLATVLRVEFASCYSKNRLDESYRYDSVMAGKRRLKNICLDFLMTIGDEEALALCLQQYKTADNMSDVMGALRPLVHSARPENEVVLEEFYQQWKDEPLVLDKWFTIQATAPLPETLSQVKKLSLHPAFSINNPNRVRSLVGAFAAGNPVCFHVADGEGYVFLADQVIALDGINPQIAARLAGNFSRWRRFDSKRQELMQGQLDRLAAGKGLSLDVYEVVVKSLAVQS